MVNNKVTSLFLLQGELGKFTEIARIDADPSPARSMEQHSGGGFGGGLTIGGIPCAARPWDGQKGWEMYQRSSIHAACCNVKAEDIVGGGFELNAEDLSEPLREEISTVIDRSVDDLVNACRDDEVTGWCGLELLPTLNGRQLYKLNHIDSWTLWVARDLSCYVHKRDRQATKYLPLGVVEPGFYQLAFKTNRSWFKNTYYGVPDALPVLLQIETAWEALKHNREFFLRRGGYRWLMIVKSGAVPGDIEGLGSGGAGDAEFVRTVNEAIRESGKDSTGDVITLPVGDREIELKQLSADLKDMDFATLLKAFRDDIRASHLMPPIKVGIVESGALGGNVGQEQLRAYRDGVVLPKQRKWNRLINEVIRAQWGVDAQFAFSPVEIDEFALLAAPVNQLWMSGLLNRGEALTKLGEHCEDDKADDYYYDLQDAQSFSPEGMAALERRLGNGS